MNVPTENTRRPSLKIGLLTAASLITVSAGAYYFTRRPTPIDKTTPKISTKTGKKVLIATAAIGCVAGLALSARRMRSTPSASALQAAPRETKKLEPGAFVAVWTGSRSPGPTTVKNSSTLSDSQIDAIIRLASGYKHLAPPIVKNLITMAAPFDNTDTFSGQDLGTDEALVGILNDPTGITQNIPDLMSIKGRKELEDILEQHALPIQFFTTTLDKIKEANIWFF